MVKIVKVWIDGETLFGESENGKVFRQSLLWYPRLYRATKQERKKYEFGLDGIHWRELDEDVSFESFAYEDTEPSSMQRFFLTHPEINVSGFAQSIGMNATLLRNYINGFKKPSKEREEKILNSIRLLGKEMSQIAIG